MNSKTLLLSAALAIPTTGLVTYTLVTHSTGDGYHHFPTNQTTFSNSIALIKVPRSNLLDTYTLLWSPYSNCCFYPIVPDEQHASDSLFTYYHDFHIPNGSNFGFWKAIRNP